MMSLQKERARPAAESQNGVVTLGSAYRALNLSPANTSRSLGVHFWLLPQRGSRKAAPGPNESGVGIRGDVLFDGIQATVAESAFAL